MKANFKPHHINVSFADLNGNNGIGPYILLPGSDGRAKEIAEHFNDVTVKKHERGHNLYLGTIKSEQATIDIATIATGMGSPSVEIIIHELFHLGGKRFIRVGTAGSLQPETVTIGDIVSANASVRDEHTTRDYLPIEIPAIASHHVISAIQTAANKLKFTKRLHTGIVHCKSSFYAREYGAGPLGKENLHYSNLLTQSGVLATEMETSALFVQSMLYNQALKKTGEGPQFSILAGALLGIINVPPNQMATQEEAKQTVASTIELSLETVKVLFAQEKSLFCK